ncbi:membrane-spanning 4-domains subfamily A member 4A [Fundulus heteroclitus]|uniref:membrane-spanning 4-domains subfamily A member 4A n=1 Tax=Fundulus heteroclitus TaxID=8078 RepID=UPI00165BA549|nr:membrane-spanning 4-domains subfamily A member 4A [Fundulus heteroclitus]
MTSTSVTTVGGVTIITQVIPKDDASIPLQTPASPTARALNPVPKTPPHPSEKGSKETTFLRGEPQGLGVVQIFIGVLCVLFSLTVLSTRALIIYVPFALGVLFVVSGSLAVATGRHSSVKLVWVSLVSNVFSVLLGVAGVTYDCVLLASGRPSEMFCNFQTSNVDFQTPNVTDSAVDKWKLRCPRDLRMLDELLYGLMGVFLVLLVLQVSVSITVCVFSGRMIRSHKRYSSIVEEDDSCSLPSGASECSTENNHRSESP